MHVCRLRCPVTLIVPSARRAGALPEPQELLPPNGTLWWPAVVIAVTCTELVAEGGHPLGSGAVVVLLEGEELALAEELVGRDHVVAARRELEVGVGRWRRRARG